MGRLRDMLRKAPVKPVLTPEERQERLDKLGIAIAEKRKEAIEARKESGIEDVWLACEEAYLGIDDANRSEFAKAKWAKPTSMEGAVTTESYGSTEGKSTAFVRLTSRYVDVGSAKISEIVLPINDKAFSFEPTPVPDLIKSAKDLTPFTDEFGQHVMRDARPDEMPLDAAAATVGAPPGPQPLTPGAAAVPQVPITVKDVAEAKMAKAKEAAKKAEKRIYDWMVECNYPAEMRKVLFDSARIGVGVLKGPFPDVKKSQALTRNANVLALEIQKKVVPALRWIDPWNLFPDGACGENVHNGDGIFERDFLAQRKVKELIGQKGYITSQIKKVLKEGPEKCNEDGFNPNEKVNKNRYTIWYYFGTLSRDDMAIAQAVGLDELDPSVEDVHAIITMINDTVVRATINPSEQGKFPYHVKPWSRRAGHWAGVGPGEQVSMPQRMVNAATRAMLNNAGNSAGLQLIIDRASIVPADGAWNITPNKIWWKTDEAAQGDVRAAMAAIEFPNQGQQLMAIIDYAFRLAEEATNIPIITQGQVGPTTPDTFGATELQNNNANTLLRNIGYSVDDDITEPVVHMLYEWLLLDPDVPDDEKGDFQINAHGSAAMVEKAIQEQTLLALGQMALNPAFGVDPKKWFSQYLTAKRLDPRDIQYTEEEQAKMAQQSPPPPVQVQVEQVRGQNALQVEQAKTQGALQQVQQEAAHEQQMLQSGGTTPHIAQATARIEQEKIRAISAERVEESRAHAEAARADKELMVAQQNGDMKEKELAAKERIMILEYANKRDLSLDQVRVELTKSSMQEETKRQLAAAEIQLAQNENAKDRVHDAAKHVTSLQRDTMSTDVTP